jgi:hypothetical protein
MTRHIATKTAILLAAATLVAPAGLIAASQIGTTTASAATAETVNWQIALRPGSAFPTAQGGAQYQSQPGQKELQVEVEHIKALAGKLVMVSVNGTPVGTAKVSLLGIAQLSRNTELGQRVPTVTKGSNVRVTTVSGVVIASGVF